LEFNLGKSQKLVTFSTSDWHKRFQQQATWTQDFRSYLFRSVITPKNLKILEVGSGTGAITYHINKLGRFSVFGVDILSERVQFAQKNDVKSHFSTANGLLLPFANDCFDVTCCHYYLMWVSSPIDAVAEMARVTKTGGRIIVMAEPDYSRRNALPGNLVEIGALQFQALQAQGANPEIGGKVQEIFRQLSLNIEESGMYKTISGVGEKENLQQEIAILRHDLAFICEDSKISKLISTIQHTFNKKKFQWSVPTFYICGTK
jgi:ubiquinone/menaquinone biosynthesis C-methylase UbiE